MIKVENIDVWGFEHAVRGLRNPLNSWDRSDSIFVVTGANGSPEIQARIGENDLDLMRRLYKGGTEHRKYLRQITISMDITAPLYWWKQFDQYKIYITTNSCSTMHKIAYKKFELDDFSHEHLVAGLPALKYIIDILNIARDTYLTSKNKEDWWQLIQLLPSSYNQRRTITMNYENAVSMIKQRSNHKLDEWHEFCDILKSLPYMEEIIGENNEQS